MQAIIVATIALGLPLDAHWARHGQAAASAAAWIVCVALWMRTPRPRRGALVACLVLATAGEAVLSLAWGLYRYRLGNIPLFVPPGHVLLFYLGTRLAERLPDGAEWAIAAAGCAAVAAFAWTGHDTMGPLLFALFLACMLVSPSRKLYATMFALSLAMEVYGTRIGNWTWAARVPGLGLTAANPPVAAGAFYAVLDLLVVSAAAALARARGSAAGEPRLEAEGGLAPGGDLERVLVAAIAPDELQAERQPARAAPGGDRHGR